MLKVTIALWKDDAGFILSSELILIATIAVLSMVVGLAEVSHAINQELEDVASAFGAVNQTYRYQGLGGHGGAIDGSGFQDRIDFCDSAQDVVGTEPVGEAQSYHQSW